MGTAILVWTEISVDNNVVVPLISCKKIAIVIITVSSWLYINVINIGILTDF